MLLLSDNSYSIAIAFDMNNEAQNSYRIQVLPKISPVFCFLEKKIIL